MLHSIPGTRKRTTAVDQEVGARIRSRRRALGLSLQTVAAQLGIAYQQLQKYERGSNRVSASRLHEIARLLNMSVGALFGENVPQDDPALDEARALAQAFARLDDAELQRMVAELVMRLADRDVQTSNE